MVDPREPGPTPDPGAPAPPPEGEPHDLVEEIQHELEEVRHDIEEVVEHVPKPIRWTVGKLTRLILLSLGGLIVVLVVTAVLYVANRTEWAARELTLLINQTLRLRTNVELTIRDIKGNPLTGVRAYDPRLNFREGEKPLLLAARSMTLRYSLWGLATGQRDPIIIDLDRPVFRLERGPNGKLVLPTWTQGPARPGGRALSVVLRVHNGTIASTDSTLTATGVDLDVLAALGKATHVDLRSMRVRSGPFGSVLHEFAADLAVTDSTHLTIRTLRTGDLTLHARAAWPLQKGEGIVHAELRDVRWRWLARVFRNGTFNVPGHGSAVVDAQGRTAWRGRFRTTADWDSLALEAQGGLAWGDGNLKLSPLVGHSLAGDLDGEVTWSKLGWQVGGIARTADPSHWNAIGLIGWPAGKLNGRFRYAVDTRAKPKARLDAILGGSEWAGWRADSGSVVVKFDPDAPDSFRVVAVRRGGEMTLTAVADQNGWRGPYTLARFPLDEWPDGRASGIRGVLANGRGTVDSHAGGLAVTGTLDGVATDWFGMHAARWRLDAVRGAMLPVPDLVAEARLEDVTFIGLHFDSVTSPVHLGDRRLEMAGLAAAASDTTIRLAGLATWDTQGWRLEADRASATSSQFHWNAQPPFVLSGDPHGVTFERVTATDSTARLAVRGHWAAPGGRYDWHAHVEGLDLARIGLPPDWRMAGHVEGDLDVDGVSGDPRWRAHAVAQAPGMNGHGLDSLALRLSGAPGRLVVEDAHGALADGRFTAHGEVSGTGHPWPDTLTSDGVVRWLSDAARWNGNVAAQRLSLDRLERLAPAAKGWHGSVSGSVDIAGRPDRPQLTAQAEARPFGWQDYRVDAVSVRARYDDERLEVLDLKMERGNVASAAHGTIPLRLALGRKPEAPDAPISGAIDLPNGDLGLLPLFVPQLGSASGKFDLNAKLAGTVRQPEITGRAHVREGRLRMTGREEVLDQVSADLTLSRSRLTLDTLSARQATRRGAPGIVSGSGVVALKGFTLEGYRFGLRMRDFTALESGSYMALFDGDFNVTDGPKVGGSTLPLVTGDVELRRGILFFDFANQSEVQQVAATTQPLYWLYRIQVNATDNLRWQTPDADIECSADLRLEQTPDSLIIFGDVEALRGSYYFLSNRFSVQSGTLTFDNVEGVNPKIDAVAITSVPRSASSPGGSTESGSENITVTLKGRAREPQVEFSSESAWDEPTILRAITTDRFVQNDRLALGDPVDNYLTRALNRQLSSQMSDLFKGYLNQWELSREQGGLFTGGGDVTVKVGSQINRNLTINYRQRVPGSTRPITSPIGYSPFERDVEAEYRLNRFFYVTSQLTQRRTLTGTVSSVSTSPEFNVSLKARWEY